MIAPGLRRLSPFRIALLATLAAAVLYLPVSQLGIVQDLEGELLDLRFHARPPQPTSGQIVLVLIDDASLSEVGRWPWSRSIMADLVARLEAAGARTVALDLLLPEPERAAVPTDALEPLLQEPDAAARLPALIARAEGDRRLAAEARRSGNVVLPILLEPAPDAAAPAPLPGFVADAAFRVVQQGAAAGLGEPPAADRVLAPIAQLGEAAAGLGHVNAPLDRSGAQRLEYPVIAYGADYLPSFSLEIARRQLGVGRDRVRLVLGEGVALGERFVPTDESMRLAIDYDRPGRFPAVSAAAVLRGDAPALFADRIALIGGTAAGLGNSFVTPFSSLMPEVERHATVVDGILRGDFLLRREASVLVDLAAVIAAGVLIGWATGRRGMAGASAAFLLIATGLVAANMLAFVRFGLWLNLFLPLAALAFVYLAVLAYSYLVGKRQERLIRGAFEHYLSPDLVELVVRDPALLRLGGEQRELTVLFADIRDSTRLAQRLPPERFAALLNDTLGAMTGTLFARGGMLDKFTGDGLLAIFGAPLPQPDHALRACRAALDMLQAVEAVRARWAGLELPLEIGIGINSGPMLIGNMGSQERFTYTVIGDEAHLGARLEEANKDFRTRILISEATFAKVRDKLAARELDRMKFRGLEQPVRVFELLGERPLAPPAAQRLERFEAALASYRSGDLAAAAARFEALRAEACDDYPLAIWLGRCRTELAAAGIGVQPAGAHTADQRLAQAERAPYHE